ncbi:TerD family protein [Psychrobacter sp. Ps3]|uniref:TerD family protein n=1 Tax=Psychrobacter sp. Ps3 TaxID=2790957 RepID=UPI001EDF06C4|nr:TerD family protein [Psychrobacter sp. Ps3]MCG3882920.1 TerD family protein [Psychrobacter sp. Ps3]
MSASTPTLPLSESLSALDFATDRLFFAMNYQFTPPKATGLKKRLKQNDKAIDVDIACVLYDDDCVIDDIVWFKQLRDKAESVRHQGDSLNGKDRGEQALYNAPLDQEQIRLYLDHIPAHIRHVAMIVHSYNQQPLAGVEAGEVHLSDDEYNRAFTVDLKQLPRDCYGLWVANLRRGVDDWYLTVQQLPLEAEDIEKLAQQVAHELARTLPIAQPTATPL